MANYDEPIKQTRALDMFGILNLNGILLPFLDGKAELMPLGLVEGRSRLSQIYYPSRRERRRQVRRKPRKSILEFSYIDKCFTIPKDLVSKEENFLANMVINYLFKNIVVFIYYHAHGMDFKQLDFDESFRILNAIKNDEPEVVITYTHTEGRHSGSALRYKVNIRDLVMSAAHLNYQLMVVPLRGNNNLSRYLYWSYSRYDRPINGY